MDLSRNRCWLFSILKEDELMRDFFRNGGLGISFKFDSTPMRLFVDKKNCLSIEVMVSCIALHSDSDVRKASPLLCRPSSKDSNGLLGCLDLKNSWTRTH